MAIGEAIRNLGKRAMGKGREEVEPYYPPTQNVPIGLPKQIESLCPECGKIIPAKILERDGKVLMEKTCPDHGFIDDVVYGDADLYKKAERWTYEDGDGILNPQVTGAKVCPDDCGICDLHIGHAAVANLDLTNRCNLRCPICFANANVQGYVYEPTYEQVVEMLKMARNVKPVFPPAVQFSGGEPTIHPRFLDILKAARSLGFSHLQIASNGIRIAKSLEFAKQCEGSRPLHGVPAVRRNCGRSLPEDPGIEGAVGPEAEGRGKRPGRRPAGRPGADDHQDPQRRPGGKHSAVCRRQFGYHQRDQLPARGLYRQDLHRGKGTAAVYPVGSGP